ncbi:hypothetical protein GCM10009755_24360 [Brevibacterium samyangense]|uniref:RDD family protein n=1 Tax=Brevibacterium samyangense TaxID=366888 RepID=A0ABN2TJY0_9MICO
MAVRFAKASVTWGRWVGAAVDAVIDAPMVWIMLKLCDPKHNFTGGYRVVSGRVTWLTRGL